MKNLTNITNYIKFEEFFNIAPNLKQLSNGTFSLYKISDNSLIIDTVYVGCLNNYLFFFPILLNSVSEFIIFNKNVKPLLKNSLNISQMYNKTFIYNMSVILTKSDNLENLPSYFKNTNRFISLESDKKNFKYTLEENSQINFKEVITNLNSLEPLKILYI